MPKNSPLIVDIGQGLSLMVGMPNISSWTNMDRPKNARRGILGFNSETSELEYYDGESWYGAKLSQA